MATFDELLTASGHGGLINKVRVATFCAATSILLEDAGTINHANRMLWAKTVYTDTAAAGLKMMWPVLALNKTETYANIIAANDATVQTAVNAAVNVFANGV